MYCALCSFFFSNLIKREIKTVTSIEFDKVLFSIPYKYSGYSILVNGWRHHLTQN